MGQCTCGVILFKKDDCNSVIGCSIYGVIVIDASYFTVYHLVEKVCLLVCFSP